MRKLALWLSFIMIFTIPCENAISIIGFGTFTRLIGWVLLAAWILSVLAKGEFRKPHLFHLVSGFFIFINVVSVFWSYDVTASISRIITYIQLFTLSVILWDLYSTSGIFQTGLQAYVLGAYVSIGSVVINYINGQVISPYEFARYSGAELNANDLALILILGLPVAWYLAISTGNHSERRLLNLVNYAYIPTATFTIILIASRVSLFAIVPAFVYILTSMRYLKLGFRILLFLTLISIVIVLPSYIPQSSIQRYATIGKSIADLDLGGRVTIWYAALSVFIAHPILGIGSGALSTIIGAVAHNTFLSVLAELGILGIIFFLLVLAIVLYQAVIQPKRYSTLWLAVIAIWVISVSTLTWEYYKPTWLFMCLIVVSASLVTKENVPKLNSFFTQYSSLEKL